MKSNLNTHVFAKYEINILLLLQGTNHLHLKGGLHICSTFGKIILHDIEIQSN